MSVAAGDTIVAEIAIGDQEAIIQEVRAVLREAPLVRPTTPNGTPMRVRVSAAGELGWVGDGAYRYDAAQRDGRPWPPIPQRWIGIAEQVAGRHAWDSAIVNWYEPDAALGWHRDQAEADRSFPIVTLSLGDACSWAVREDKDARVSRCRLESGHVTLLAGPTRHYLHAVERIIPTPLFSPLGTTRGRISITLRVAGPPKKEQT
jgi:alkylated DNA repair protein (DNA oxidative demethylase)